MVFGFGYKSNMNKQVWSENLEGEVRFWRNWLPKHAKEYSEQTQLRSYFKELIAKKKKVDVLDVGSGAISTIGYTWPGTEVNLILTDYLADEYMKLFVELGINPPMVIKKEDMCNLSYPDGKFDIVHCRNALDHCANPIKAIQDMVRVCKPGGWIYLAHFGREGMRRNYTGLHQWNITEENGRCTIWNRKERYVLSDYVSGFTSDVFLNDDGKQGGITMKKQKEITIEDKWKSGVDKTLDFYRSKWPWKAKQFNREMDLPPYFEDMIGQRKEVKIADIGAGMFCILGSKWKDLKVEMVACDVLADEFKKILDEHDVVRLIPVEKQDMENLSYPDNYFDIVHCANALDHTVNPIKALDEMKRICKPGGYVYLRHYPNVGINEEYYGLHQWNIDIVDENTFRIWNPDKTEFVEGFKSKVGREWDYEPENMIISIFQKHD